MDNGQRFLDYDPHHDWMQHVQAQEEEDLQLEEDELMMARYELADTDPLRRGPLVHGKHYFYERWGKWRYGRQWRRMQHWITCGPNKVIVLEDKRPQAGDGISVWVRILFPVEDYQSLWYAEKKIKSPDPLEMLALRGWGWYNAWQAGLRMVWDINITGIFVYILQEELEVEKYNWCSMYGSAWDFKKKVDNSIVHDVYFYYINTTNMCKDVVRWTNNYDYDFEEY